MGDVAGRVSAGGLALLRTAVGVVTLAAMAIGFAVSFAALVYTGPLAPVLATGIAMTLLGAAAMALVGGVLFTVRGTLAAPQDVTSLLLGLAAGSIVTRAGVSAEAILPTIVAFTVTATLAAGVASFAIGRLGLARLVRYVPYTVVGGFLAATGYLLVMAAISIVLRQHVDIWTLGRAFAPTALPYWLPWILGGAAMVVATRVWNSDVALPAAPIVALAVFYGSLAMNGQSLDAAAAAGLLLGPFPEGGLLSALGAGVGGPVDWGLILTQVPTILAVIGLALLGGLLNGTGLEMTLHREVDFDRDMVANGSANIAAGLFGGLPGYTILVETILARRLGLTGLLPPLAVAASLLVALVFGAEVLSYLPAGLVAMLIAYLGLDLLHTWLVRERARLLAHEHGVILLILVVAATVGFLQAVATGFAAAFVIFVISYGRTDPVRLRATAATRVSRIERGEAAAEVLARAGAGTVILDLTGHLFFGSANRILERVRAERAHAPPPERIVLNFERVHGIDASAAQSLARIVVECREAGVRPIFSGLSDGIDAQYARAAAPDALAERHGSLEDALEALEAEDLAADPPAERGGLGLVEAARALAAAGHGSEVDFDEGAILLELGTASREIYVLTAGAARAEVPGRNGARYLVARFLPGALIGEIAAYTGRARTAWVVAEEPSRAIRIDVKALPDDGAGVARFHREAARSLSRRVQRMTTLVRDADL